MPKDIQQVLGIDKPEGVGGSEPCPEVTAQPVPAEHAKLVGIGGWLILPAIGLALGPIISVLGLIVACAMFHNVADAGYGGLYALSIFVDFALLLFMLYAAVRFFGKKKDAPAIFITMLVISLVASFVLLGIEVAAEAEAFVVQSAKQVVRGIIGAGIWIPYFSVSKRVKYTFVN